MGQFRKVQICWLLHIEHLPQLAEGVQAYKEEEGQKQVLFDAGGVMNWEHMLIPCYRVLMEDHFI